MFIASVGVKYKIPHSATARLADNGRQTNDCTGKKK